MFFILILLHDSHQQPNGCCFGKVFVSEYFVPFADNQKMPLEPFQMGHDAFQYSPDFYFRPIQMSYHIIICILYHIVNRYFYKF